eukprot:1756347-Alexandrium_andersonii.AAC.1
MIDHRREMRNVYMGEKARGGPRDEQGHRCGSAMDPSLLQQFTASGLILGSSSDATDSRDAWKLLARVRER